MKSIVPTRLAAALLLAPLGFLAAQPAAAQSGHVPGLSAVVQQPMIERFVLRTEGRIEPGEQVHFRLRGVAGGQAFVDVPGVLRATRLNETRPGIYEAAYLVRQRDNPAAFSQAVATLQRGGIRVTSRVDDSGWARPAARDRSAPAISELTPANGDRVGDRRATRISARVSDSGSGIAPGSVQLRLDGRDVTGRTRVEGDQVRFRDELAPGRHVAELVVRDRAGNATRRAWSFDVVDRDRGDRYSHYRGDQRW